MVLWPEPCFVLGVGLHTDDLAESNYCRIGAFKSALRRRLKASIVKKSLGHLLSPADFC